MSDDDAPLDPFDELEQAAFDGRGGLGGRPDDAVSGERVHSLVSQGRFAEAHALVSDAFVERNGSAGYLLRAWVLTQERRPAQAREAVDWALALAGPAEAADVFVLAGVVLLSLDEAHAALTVALRAYGADPDGWEPSVLLSDVYRRLGRLPDAVAAARRAVTAAPREPEAQVALARSLSAGRGLTGRIPRRHRAEYAAVVRRALDMGAEPAQLTAPRGGLVVGAVGLALFWATQLYWVETGGPWQLITGGALLAVTFVAAVLVVRSGTRRSGIGPRARLRAVRATTRTEMAGDSWLWRISAVHVAGVLPLPMLLTTGLVADRGWRGQVWPLWAAVPTTLAGLAAVLLLVAGVPWWYGSALARRIVHYGGLVRMHLAGAAALSGGTLALAARGDATTGQWAFLAAAHLVWAVGAGAGALLAAARLQARRRAAL